MRDFLFRCLLPMSLAGSALFLLSLALRPFYARLGARIQRITLLAVAILLLLPLPLLFNPGGPFAASTNLHREGLPAALQAAPATAPAYYAGEALSAALETTPKATISPVVPTAETQLGTPPSWFSFDTFTLISLAYLTGIVGLLCLYGIRYFLFWRKMKISCTPVEDPRTIQLYITLCDKYQLVKAPRLLQSETVGTPLLFGLFRPCILLPQEQMNEGQLEFALRHELTHYKNHDITLKHCILFACLVHWANPLVWLLKKDWNHVSEHLCDEHVTRYFNESRRKAYVATLFQFATAKAPFAAAGFASPAAMLKKRFQKLLHPTRPSRVLQAAISLALCLGVCVCLLASCSLAAGAASPDSSDLSRFPAEESVSLPNSSLAVSSTPSLSPPAHSGSSSLSGAATSPLPLPDSPTGETGYLFPVPGYTECGRGLSQGHRGLDITANEGTAIFAAAAGTVLASGWHYSYGYYVEIQHEDGFSTLYAHCSALDVAEGDEVEQGSSIAAVGSTGNSTGPQCHFEMHDANGNLLDPLDYITPPPVSGAT